MFTCVRMCLNNSFASYESLSLSLPLSLSLSLYIYIYICIYIYGKRAVCFPNTCRTGVASKRPATSPPVELHLVLLHAPCVCVCVLCRVIWAWNRDDTKVLDIPYPKPSSSRSQTGPQCCLTEMFLSPSMSFGWEVLVCFLAAGHDRG